MWLATMSRACQKKFSEWGLLQHAPSALAFESKRNASTRWSRWRKCCHERCRPWHRCWMRCSSIFTLPPADTSTKKKTTYVGEQQAHVSFSNLKLHSDFQSLRRTRLKQGQATLLVLDKNGNTKNWHWHGSVDEMSNPCNPTQSWETGGWDNQTLSSLETVKSDFTTQRTNEAGISQNLTCTVDGGKIEQRHLPSEWRTQCVDIFNVVSRARTFCIFECQFVFSGPQWRKQRQVDLGKRLLDVSRSPARIRVGGPASRPWLCRWIGPLFAGCAGVALLCVIMTDTDWYLRAWGAMTSRLEMFNVSDGRVKKSRTT